MKTTKLFTTLGCSLIILGFSLSYFNPEVQVQQETKPISHERNCLIEAVWHEARNTSYKEKMAVTEVVLNRTKHKNYPSTICEVVQQPKQFSYLNNFKANAKLLPEFQTLNSMDKKSYLEIEEIVDMYLKVDGIVSNKILPKNALHYHLKSVSPKWKYSKKKKVISLDKKFKHRYYEYIS